VGAEARAAIRQIILESLGAGGLVYVSYNCMPGWASEMPVRRLMVELAAAAPGDSADKMRHAAQALKQMSDHKLRFFEAAPEAARAVEAYGKVPANYLAHEFLNETWQPFYSVDVADEMAEAQLTFLGSATLADNHPMLVIEESAAEVMKTLATPRQVHLAMDFATNRRFRRDIFIRNDTPRSQGDAARALGEAVIGSVGDPQHLAPHVKVPRGQITFQPDFMDELKALLRRWRITIGDAVTAAGGNSRSRGDRAKPRVPRRWWGADAVRESLPAPAAGGSAQASQRSRRAQPRVHHPTRRRSCDTQRAARQRRAGAPDGGACDR
jgi:hypothetical protein